MKLIDTFLNLTVEGRKYWTQLFLRDIHTYLEEDVLEFIEDLKDEGYDMTAEAIEDLI